MSSEFKSEFKIAETDTFIKKRQNKGYEYIYKKIRDHVYSQLKINPIYGRNIRKLKGDFKYLYRFRIGDYRLFYIIDKDKNIIYIVDLQHRKDAYK